MYAVPAFPSCSRARTGVLVGRYHSRKSRIWELTEPRFHIVPAEVGAELASRPLRRANMAAAWNAPTLVLKYLSLTSSSKMSRLGPEGPMVTLSGFSAGTDA